MSDYTILLELALILLFTKLFGIICKKIGLPQVVGFLIAGLLIGPCVLGWVNPSETLKIIAELGVILIMFSAGVETDLKELKQNGLAATLAALGICLFVMLKHKFLSPVFEHGELPVREIGHALMSAEKSPSPSVRYPCPIL